MHQKDGKLEYTTECETALRATKETVNELPTATDKELDGDAMAKHLLLELKKTSHGTGRKAYICWRQNPFAVQDRKRKVASDR